MSSFSLTRTRDAADVQQGVRRYAVKGYPRLYVVNNPGRGVFSWVLMSLHPTDPLGEHSTIRVFETQTELRTWMNGVDLNFTPAAKSRNGKSRNGKAATRRLSA